MNNCTDVNKVFISGNIVSDFKFSHELYGEKFYLFDLEVPRYSDYKDILPVMISERMLDTDKSLNGHQANITGNIRSFNRKDKDKTRLVVTFFCKEIEFTDLPGRCSENNLVELEGTICKEPVYRVTPKGREITELIIASNRRCGKGDYLPCVLWGRNARYSKKLGIGTRLKVIGRAQSRGYQKTMPDGTVQERTAYELSVSKMEVIRNEE